MGVINVCLAFIRWLPVLFITLVIAWSYYAYVVQMCIITITNIPQKVIYLILYHPIFAMLVWCFWKTIFTDLAQVPKEFFLSATDLDQFERAENEEVQKEILNRLARNLPVQCRTNSGAIRYCDKCKCIKPDRAHHCSVCGKCILKMDHHCPWINNCVCFNTYKYFVLFLGYSLLYCIYVAATSLQYFIKFWVGSTHKGMGDFHVLFLFFATVMFAISITSLLSYHMFLTFVNRSTLESFRAPIFRSGPDKDGFNLGKMGNFMEIFGDDRRYWLLPIFTSNGDGVTFPTRMTPSPSSYHSMESTNPNAGNTTQPSEDQSGDKTELNNAQLPNFGDGVTYPVRTVDEDYDSLLGQRQRWMEEGDVDGSGDYVTTSFSPKANSVFINSEEE
ncbi:hypothetical protein LSH36_40g19028 [Paralvinella palmiformis]|uniref:Palmitoyltransferase n=1 Tax=Paralvinella palmiformis TaxID=53620 RepID=A0AAD9K964_9ANNE|nr:hypothetical protein LSH36_40g19028 [Paralvinella palmiformis]